MTASEMFSRGGYLVWMGLVLASPSGAAGPPPNLPRVASQQIPETRPSERAADREAIARALAFLEKDGEAWLEGRSHLNENNGCVSCHVVTFAVWSHNEAARAGVEISRVRIDDLTRRAVDFLAAPSKGRPVSWGQILLARDEPTSVVEAERWTGFRRSILEMQRREGYWRARGQFPSQRRPVSESDAVATLWSVLALSTFDEYDDREVSSVGDALGWVAGSETGKSTEWLLTRLLVEDRLGKPEQEQRFLDDLLSRQNDDGGWGFLAGDPSDAMTTGQALYALARAGESRDSAPLERARTYLLGTQGEDGTWLVPSGRISQSSDEAKDYVYQYWGTAWAVIGLSRSLGSQSLSRQESEEPLEGPTRSLQAGHSVAGRQ